MIYRGHKDIITVIRAAAADRGETMTGLAGRLGIGRTVFSRQLNNARMTIERLADIAAALGYALQVDFVPMQGGPDGAGEGPGK